MAQLSYPTASPRIQRMRDGRLVLASWRHACGCGVWRAVETGVDALGLEQFVEQGAPTYGTYDEAEKALTRDE